MVSRALVLIALSSAATTIVAQTAVPRSIGMPVDIHATAVPLNPFNPSQSSIGPFTYAGGLVLTSTQSDRLHGLSDLEVDSAERLTAVGDEGVLVTARAVLDMRGKLVNVRDGRLARLVGQDGNPLSSKQQADAEGLAQLANGDRLISFERQHRIWLYPANGGLPRAVPQPDVVFPEPNGGMEALTADPQRGADAYIVGAELTGETWACRISTRCMSAGRVDRPAGTSLVAIRRLSQGRTALLFRSGTDGIPRIVLRVVRGDAIDGQLELTPPLTVDNFEGVAALARASGVIRFYLISDDNASNRQRTLLLAFDWSAR